MFVCLQVRVFFGVFGRFFRTLFEFYFRCPIRSPANDSIPNYFRKILIVLAEKQALYSPDNCWTSGTMYMLPFFVLFVSSATCNPLSRHEDRQSDTILSLRSADGPSVERRLDSARKLVDTNLDAESNLPIELNPLLVRAPKPAVASESKPAAVQGPLLVQAPTQLTKRRSKRAAAKKTPGKSGDAKKAGHGAKPDKATTQKAAEDAEVNKVEGTSAPAETKEDAKAENKEVKEKPEEAKSEAKETKEKADTKEDPKAEESSQKPAEEPNAGKGSTPESGVPFR